MSPEQILEYAKQERYCVVVTEQMVIETMKRLASPFACRDVVEALPHDDLGSSPSEYLVTLWIENFVDRHLIRWTGKKLPRTYEIMSDRSLVEQHGTGRMHCGALSYNLGGNVEWCSVCGALRVNAENWIAPKRTLDGS